MNIKMTCLAAMALSMAAGSALAAATSTSGTSALDDPAKMQPFYTDSSMKTLRGSDEFTKAWKALTPEDQKMMMTACADEAKNANAANSHPEFCSNVKANGGSK
ncbi:hypothetical protein [Mesorhizobium sp. M0488]|uniref:hypothetical protein n=1 Tax=unclassified Mesorhizobium TaxID=325217 RepID=UPI003338E721